MKSVPWFLFDVNVHVGMKGNAFVFVTLVYKSELQKHNRFG
jgi:hypothetical protein